MPLPPPIRKAIIPATGFGTRLFPATQVVKKELFPIIDSKEDFSFKTGVLNPVEFAFFLL